MSMSILFIGWNRPMAGMEEKAYGFLTSEGMAYLKSGQGTYFDKLDMFGLTAHGGDLNGMIVLTGERAKLDELRRTDGFEAFSMKMSSLFDRYGVVPGLNWEGIQLAMQRMAKNK
jgi:hypothetical protein